MMDITISPIPLMEFFGLARDCAYQNWPLACHDI